MESSGAQCVDSQRFNLGAIGQHCCLYSSCNSKSARKIKNLSRQSLAREQEHRLALEAVEKDYLQAQNELADAQRIEALGKMASGVAHRFNNSQTIIMGSAELTRSLLSFEHKDPIKKMRVEVKSFIAALTESLSRLLPDDIALGITDVEFANILVDKSGLDWAFLNLAAKAKDAIVRAGQIFIGSKGLALTSNRDKLIPGKYSVISVSDDGAGINQDMKSHVFEPYLYTKKIGCGTGMELALLKSLIEDSKGHVQSESEYGQCTTISLFFPIAKAEKKAAALPSVDDPIPADTKELSIC